MPMKVHDNFLLMLSLCFVAGCLPAPFPVSSPASTQSPPHRRLEITSETRDPNLPQVQVPGVELKIVAGTGEEGYRNGPALEAAFHTPTGLAADSKGNLYVADSENYRIRKKDNNSLVSSLAGTGKRSHEGKTGSLLETGFYVLDSLSYFEPDRLFVEDKVNIFSLNLAEGRTELLFDSKAGPTAALPLSSQRLPFQLCCSLGDISNFAIYKGQALFSVGHELWQLSQQDGSWHLKQYAGRNEPWDQAPSIDDSLRYHVDGPAEKSSFNGPQGIAFDDSGNLYVADIGIHSIRKVMAGSRNVSTLAGKTRLQETTIDPVVFGGFKDGALKEAWFNAPTALVALGQDNLLICDAGNQALRLLAKGQVRTLIRNLSCGGMAKAGAHLYMSDYKRHVIYHLDLDAIQRIDILKLEPL